MKKLFWRGIKKKELANIDKKAKIPELKEFKKNFFTLFLPKLFCPNSFLSLTFSEH